MNSPAYDIRNYIIGVVGSLVDWPVYVSETPANSINSITCYDTSGADQIRLMDDDDIYQPYITVQVVSPSYPDAYIKCDEISKGIKRVSEFEVSDSRYCGVLQVGDWSHIGKDENDKHMLNLTIRIYRKEIVA